MNRPLLLAAISAALLFGVSACQESAPADSYLFVWAGDSAMTASNFMAVINANPASPEYGAVVASVPTGSPGTHPHHTEAEMPADGHLLANGFVTGPTWLYDLTNPKQPAILTSFGDLGGFSHPHTYFRLANGNVLATFQYAADSATATAMEMHTATGSAMAMSSGAGAELSTGGLVEMDERGTVIRSASAADVVTAGAHIFPYSVLPMPAIDRAVSTTTNMNPADTLATSEWVQFWRLSDLTLLKTIALPPGPRGDEHRYSGEIHVLPDGKSLYIHTFNCGVYLVRNIASDAPTATFVASFPGADCGVPVLTSHFWLQTVPSLHAVVALDLSDPEHPREVSTLSLGDGEAPHWLAIDETGRRLVVNSGGYAKANRVYVVNFDPTNGALTLDTNFRDTRDSLPGINMVGKTWPHGFTGTAVPHGSVFSRKSYTPYKP